MLGANVTKENSAAKKTAKPVPTQKRMPPPADPDRRLRMETLEEAVVTLRMQSVGALRARCRRAAANPDELGRAVLAPGVYAIKIGRHWRILYE